MTREAQSLLKALNSGTIWDMKPNREALAILKQGVNGLKSTAVFGMVRPSAMGFPLAQDDYYAVGCLSLARGQEHRRGVPRVLANSKTAGADANIPC